MQLMIQDSDQVARGWRRARVEPRTMRQFWHLDVLLVEDDAADTSLILDVLKRHPKVVAANAVDSPEVALRALAAVRKKPDLIFLDIHMPRMNGFQFLEAMRRLPELDRTPVVFLTTSALAKDVLSAKESTASLYVIKPDTLSELESRLDSVIRRALSGAWSK